MNAASFYDSRDTSQLADGPTCATKAALAQSKRAGIRIERRRLDPISDMPVERRMCIQPRRQSGSFRAVSPCHPVDGVDTLNPTEAYVVGGWTLQSSTTLYKLLGYSLRFFCLDFGNGLPALLSYYHSQPHNIESCTRPSWLGS